MKRFGQYLLLVVWLLWTIASLAFAGRLVTVEWEPSADQAADGYRVWNSTGTVPMLLATSSEPTAEVEIPDAEQTLTVTAWSLTGESVHSLPLTIPATTRPVTITLQHSPDCLHWTTRSVTYYQETSPVGFYRLKIETHDP